VKSIAVFICFVSFLSPAVYGETTIAGKPYAFSGTVHAGLYYGTSYEIVYQNSLSREKLSELEWELKPLLYMGLGFSLKPVNTGGGFTSFTIKAGLPAVCGIMNDRDWITPGVLTHFSSHTNTLEAAVQLTLDLGYSFSVTDRFYFRLFGSLDYLFFRMEAKDGYYSYERDNWEIITLSGPVIRFSQQWFLFSPGFSADFILNRFTLKGTLKVTPFIFCIDKDEHLLPPATTYSDYLSGKFAVEPALDISYTISTHLEAGLACSYRYITGARGDTVEEQSGHLPYIISNSAGAALNLFESSVYLKFTL
jgi:outer membrane protease